MDKKCVFLIIIQIFLVFTVIVLDIYLFSENKGTKNFNEAIIRMPDGSAYTVEIDTLEWKDDSEVKLIAKDGNEYHICIENVVLIGAEGEKIILTETEGEKVLTEETVGEKRTVSDGNGKR